MAAQPLPAVVSANRTADGSPVYLTESGSWSTHLHEARVVEDAATLEELLRAARAQESLVCDPYAFKVQRGEDGHPKPQSARERIRSQGPTITLPA